MRRLFVLVLLPFWLLAGWSGFARPLHVSPAGGKGQQPHTAKVCKAEAAPAPILQLHGPQGDVWLPEVKVTTYGRVPADQEFQPLCACHTRPLPAFGQRFATTAIALRAP